MTSQGLSMVISYCILHYPYLLTRTFPYVIAQFYPYTLITPVAIIISRRVVPDAFFSLSLWTWRLQISYRVLGHFRESDGRRVYFNSELKRLMSRLCQCGHLSHRSSVRPVNDRLIDLYVSRVSHVSPYVLMAPFGWNRKSVRNRPMIARAPVSVHRC